MKILDMSAGNRAIWYNKNHPLVTYLDKRPEVGPDIVCDTRALPAEVGDNFDLIVFDPPHYNSGQNGNATKSYGHHTVAEILDTIKGSAAEAHRVSKSSAFLALKWNDGHIRLQRVFDLMPQWEPLFGCLTKNSGTKHGSKTHWVMMRKKSDEQKQAG